MLVPVPIGNKPYVSAYTSVGREICQNLYIEQSNSDTAKAQYYLVKIPGLRLLATQTATAACRGIYTASNARTFVVNGTSFYELLQSGARTLRGTLTSYSGPVQMADNGSQLLLVDGVAGWVFDYSHNTMAKLDATQTGVEGWVDGATHCTCIDTYFLVNNPQTNEYHWSSPGDGLAWPGLNVSMKIGKPDNIVGLIDCTNMLWAFGLRSVEVHYDTGDYANGVWQRYEGAIIEVGCMSPYSIARYANNVFWLGSDKDGTVGVFSNQGMAPARISTRGIEQIVQSFDKYDDCLAFCYAQAGHAFYVMHFQSADRTFVFDIVTGSWHERTFLLKADGTLHRWRGQFAAFNWSRNLLGDNSGDAIYWSDTETYANDNPDGSGVNYIRCVKTSPIGFQNGVWVRYNSLQVILQQGVGLPENTADGVGLDPQCMIAFSNDSGTTWSTERAVSIGRRGEYGRRSRLTNLGTSRNRVWRLAITDPVPVIIVGLMADITAGPR